MRCAICCVAALLLGGCTELMTDQNPGRSVTELTNEANVPLRVSVQAERASVSGRGALRRRLARDVEGMSQVVRVVPVAVWLVRFSVV